MITPVDLRTWPTPLDHSTVVVEATIPVEPVSKQRARVAVGGRGQRFYTPSQTTEAEFVTGLIIKQQAPDLCVDDESDFGVRALFFSSTRHRRDLDNMLKLLMDSATGLVWKDDTQVMEINARRLFDRENPRTEFILHRLESQEVQHGN